MGKKHREGFTLIELLVAMMVVAIALGLGVPAFTDLIASHRMATAVNDLVSALHAARSEALTRNRTVTLCASPGWDDTAPACADSADLLDGWIIFVDRNANARVDGDDRVLQAHPPLPAEIAAAPGSGTDQPGPHYISFRSDGLLQDVAGLPAATIRNVQLCDARGNRDTGGGVAAGRWIALTPAGRPVINQQIAVLQGDGNPLGGCAS
jgi:type IV fimbrial biogenesis protein FimT